MSPRSSRPVPEIVPPDGPASVNLPDESEPPADQVEDEEFEILDRLDELRADAGPRVHNFSVVVFKRRSDGAKIERCRKFSLSEIDLDRLPELFGGGDYTLRVLDDKGKLVDVVRVAYDPSIRPRSVEDTAPRPSMDALDRLQSQLAEERREHRQFMQTILTAVIGRTTPSLADQLKDLESLRSIISPQTEHSPVSESGILEAVKLGMAMVREGGGGADEGEGGDVMAKIVDRFGPPILEKILTLGKGPGRRPAPRPSPAAAGQPGNLPPEWQQYAFLRARVTQAMAWAQKKRNPSLLADLIYEFLPEEHLDALNRFVHLAPETRAEILGQLDGRLSLYRDYLDRVAEELCGILDEGEPDDTAASDTAQ